MWRTGGKLLSVLGLSVLAACCGPQRTEDRCLADTGGCESPTALPACEAGTVAIPLGQALVDAGTLVGQTVAVTGPLRRASGTCTELDCGEGACCNDCGAPLALRESTEVDDHHPDYLWILETLSPFEFGRFSCKGDESVICCPYEVDREVVAMGTFELVGVVESLDQGNYNKYAITGASLCVR